MARLPFRRRRLVIAMSIVTWLQPLLALSPPAWWNTQNVLNDQPSDDYAVANVGQLKTIARKAVDELIAIRGSPGPDIQAMMQNWATTGEDYRAVTVGEVKSVAFKFYDMLGVQPPWTSTNYDDDNYALANIGQIKTAFAFDIKSNLLGSPDQDYDHDGISNGQEFLLGTNAEKWDSDGDGVSDGRELSEGTDYLNRASSSASLLALSFRSRIE